MIWGGEFGRTSMNEARGGSKFLGRDHHPHCFSIWMAGGGIKPGITVGATDDLGYTITDNPVSIHDLQATILHLLGLDAWKLTYAYQGLEPEADRPGGRGQDPQGAAGVTLRPGLPRTFVDVSVASPACRGLTAAWHRWAVPPRLYAHACTITVPTSKPRGRVGVGRHPPVAAGREADRADLGTVGDARPLVLLAEEPGVERPHRPLDQLARIGLREAWRTRLRNKILAGE